MWTFRTCYARCGPVGRRSSWLSAIGKPPRTRHTLPLRRLVDEEDEWLADADETARRELLMEVSSMHTRHPQTPDALCCSLHIFARLEMEWRLALIKPSAQVMLGAYERRRFQTELINEMPLYPTERLLWDEHQIPSVNYTGACARACRFMNLVCTPGP